MPARSRILEEVASESLLGLVPGLTEFALEAGELVRVRAGQEVCQQGDSASHFIMPVDESLRLEFSATGERELVGHLKRGRSLALGQLLRGAEYPYFAVAETTTTILKIPRDPFVRYLGRYPNYLHYLRVVTESEGIRQVKEFLEDAGLETASVVEFFSHVPKHTHALSAGRRLSLDPPRRIFVKSGLLHAANKPSADHRFEVEVEEGDFFGGEGLVPPHEVSYEVEALEKTEYHAVECSDVQSFLESAGVVDALFEEPRLRDVRAPKTSFGEERELSDLPGEPVDPSEIPARDLHLNPEQLREAETDAESVPTTLVNIGSLLGVSVNLSAVRTELELAEQLTPLRVAEVLEPFGLFVSARQVEFDQLDRIEVPAILRFGPRLAILLAIEGTELILVDPAQGIVRVRRSELEPHWDGELLQVRVARDIADPADQDPEDEPDNWGGSGDGEAEEDRRSETLGLFTGILGEFQPTLVNVGLLALLGVGLGLLLPKMSEWLLNEVLSLRDPATVWALVIGMGLVVLANAAVQFSQVWLLALFSYRYDYLLSAQFYRKALRVPTSFYDERKVGELLSRLDEIANVRNFLSGSSLRAVINLFSILAYGVVLIWYGWYVSAVAGALVLSLLLVRYLYKDRLHRRQREAYEADARAQSLLSEQISSMTTLKAQGAEEIMRRRWERAFLRGVERRRDLQIDSTTISGLASFLGSLAKVGAIYFTASLVLDGELQAGAILAVSMYMSNMIGPTKRLAELLSEWEDVKVSFDKIGDVFHGEEDQPPSRAQSTHAIKLRGKIRLEHVDFRYSEDTPLVLRDLNLTIYPNQIVAVVGPSGCGKTTLAKVIAGTLQPDSGQVYFDGFDRSFLSLSSLRKQIGFIMQDEDLFEGSIAENIAYGDDAPDRDRVRQAARDAAAVEFINQFPEGYEHHLAEGGIGLSGGQKQRIAIARTLYRRPQVLLFDEATSNLDAESEKAIVDNMREILEGKTAIVIAHRLSTIRNADRIVVMDEGRVVEDGSHQELLNKEGFYAELFEGQMVGV